MACPCATVAPATVERLLSRLPATASGGPSCQQRVESCRSARSTRGQKCGDPVPPTSWVRAGADLATVEIDQLRVAYEHALGQTSVVGDQHVSGKYYRRPDRSRQASATSATPSALASGIGTAAARRSPRSRQRAP